MKKVLVTGADGFIGSHLTELLLKNDYKVKALSYYNSFNYNGWLEDVGPDPKLEIVSGDIRDPYFVKDIMKDSDIVFHLAALIAIPFSYTAPESYLETNARGTLNILQASREYGGIRVLHTSTSEVYGTAKYVPIDENHPKQPQSPYSASKIAADAMAMSFYNSFNLPVTIVRPFNTFGPRQSARAVIPTIITQIAAGTGKIKLGSVSPVRDLNYVADICRAFLSIAENDNTTGKEINIATGTGISILDLFKLIKEIMRSEAEYETDEIRLRPENSEVFRLIGDNGLIHDLTGFTPKYDLREGLEITCEWFRKEDNLRKYKSHQYNL
jgi:NAD dependent epimerase/dehydratase